jgi:hypothetical protein
LPQGLLKKIQFNLLLADLALQFADALARRRKILGRLKIGRSKPLTRATGRSQRFRPATPEMNAPFV